MLLKSPALAALVSIWVSPQDLAGEQMEVVGEELVRENRRELLRWVPVRTRGRSHGRPRRGRVLHVGGPVDVPWVRRARGAFDERRLQRHTLRAAPLGRQGEALRLRPLL